MKKTTGHYIAKGIKRQEKNRVIDQDLVTGFKGLPEQPYIFVKGTFAPNRTLMLCIRKKNCTKNVSKALFNGGKVTIVGLPLTLNTLLVNEMYITKGEKTKTLVKRVQ